MPNLEYHSADAEMALSQWFNKSEISFITGLVSKTFSLRRWWSCKTPGILNKVKQNSCQTKVCPFFSFLFFYNVDSKVRFSDSCSPNLSVGKVKKLGCSLSADVQKIPSL